MPTKAKERFTCPQDGDLPPPGIKLLVQEVPRVKMLIFIFCFYQILTLLSVNQIDFKLLILIVSSSLFSVLTHIPIYIRTRLLYRQLWEALEVFQHKQIFCSLDYLLQTKRTISKWHESSSIGQSSEMVNFKAGGEVESVAKFFCSVFFLPL